MAALDSKVQDGLDELRMLVLGIQVFIGFGFRAVLEPGFARLPHGACLVKLVALTLLLVAFALTLAPAADHRICERGTDTPAFHRLVTRFASLALVPFAAAIALDMAVATVDIVGRHGAFWVAVAVGSVAIAMWFGIELLARRGKDRLMTTTPDETKPATLSDRIHHVLTEARVVLPGAQALLAFQLSSTLVDGFAELPHSLKLLHFASLSAVAVSTIILITPAAWHRLVERGEETERFHRIASALVLAALVPLALGICGDFYIAAERITHSSAFATVMVVALGLIFFVLWFAIGLLRRASASALTPPARPRWVET